MPTPRQLVHTEWFDFALQRLAELPRADEILSEELYRLALYADLVPLAPDCQELRVYQTKEFLRADGHLLRILIYFALHDNNTVELQHIEVVAEHMLG
ncbi:MAG TPA: hypothetical protein VGE76_24535 [Opitutaceae bacterium]